MYNYNTQTLKTYITLLFSIVLLVFLTSCVTNSPKLDIHRAAANGDTKTIQQYLKTNSKVDNRSKAGTTPLMQASLAGQNEVVQLLIEKGADVNAQNNNSLTPLYVASSQGHKIIVSLLLENGAIVNHSKPDGRTPLYSACAGGHESIAKQLIKHGAKVNISTNKGFTPLHVATLGGHEEVVKILLDAEAAVNTAALHGHTPLHAAADKGYDSLVKLLLAFGASPDVVTSKKKLTPLHMSLMPRVQTAAIKKNRKKLNAIGLNVPSDKKLLANPERAAAMLMKQLEEVIKNSASNDLKKTYKLMKDISIEMNVPKSEKSALLLIAVTKDVNAKDALGMAPLHWAASTGAYKAAVMLVDYNANLNVKSLMCLTPLHDSVGGGKTDIADLLISHGADTEVYCKAGGTPLQLAFFHIAWMDGEADKSIFKRLLAKSTRPNDIKKIKEQAIELGMTDVVEMIDSAQVN